MFFKFRTAARAIVAALAALSARADPRRVTGRASRSAFFKVALVIAPTVLLGQERTTVRQSAATRSVRQPNELDALVRLAEVANPSLRAAHARLAAARARIRPAGARPDPTLTAGIVNLQISPLSLTDDDMTMLMVGLGQSLPYPGKLGLLRRAAAGEADAADATMAAVRLEVVRGVREAYYDLAYARRALALVDPNQQILADVARIAEVRYGSGIGSQQDVLRARVEATRFAETASTLLEQQRASLAQLNAALDRASDTPVTDADFPDRIVRAAVATEVRDVHFLDTTTDARAAGSPLPSLAALQARAGKESPMLRQRQAIIAAQTARAEYARASYKPDFDVTLQYGQRQGRPDMVTAQVSVPLRIQKSARQDPQLAEAHAELAAVEADYAVARNGLHADVARLLGLAEQSRTLLALYTVGMLPYGRAAVAASLANYRTGQADMATVLTAESALFTTELAYARAMTDFAKAIAALEQVVGATIVAESAS